jgi:hypothetical protein
LRQAGFQSLLPVSAFLRSEKAEYSAILLVIRSGFLLSVLGDAAHYRAGRCRKANIAPLLFDWPTPKSTGRAGRLAPWYERLYQG